ncbi:DNA repair protein REV1 [Apiospora rasikravindrae]|uniref:DNA repair protein REV1 n=1 Tax=Apiospora rasikravindrae TaxID=990691 RepID=A0ABR1T6N9_9PEZI
MNNKRRDAGKAPQPMPPQSVGTAGKPKTSAGAAQPQFGSAFDPWNSSSSGHQRAENRLGASTGWRDSRNAKLHSQFRGDARRVSDAVGAGARDWDPKLQAVVPPELRARARCSVADMLVKPGTMQRSLSSLSSTSSPSISPGIGGATTGTANKEGHTTEVESRSAENARRTHEENKEVSPDRQDQGPGRLFAGVVVYVNGSTHPQISDHKLKHVLAEHGGRLSSHLGRKQVTHVILGRPAGGGGAGGGLAGTKLQKEIQKVRGAAVKILESIRAGKRLPETRFSNVKVASKGQQSVLGLYSKPAPLPPAPAASAAESCRDSPGTLGDEPPPSAQRN